MTVKKTVVYVAGKFRGANLWEQEHNIRRAEEAALDLWREGYVALCPHLNTRFFQGAAPDEVWLSGDIELLSRCDAIWLVYGWEQSQGSLAEVAFAKAHNIPIFTSMIALAKAFPND